MWNAFEAIDTTVTCQCAIPLKWIKSKIYRCTVWQAGSDCTGNEPVPRHRAMWKHIFIHWQPVNLLSRLNWSNHISQCEQRTYAIITMSEWEFTFHVKKASDSAPAHPTGAKWNTRHLSVIELFQYAIYTELRLQRRRCLQCANP